MTYNDVCISCGKTYNNKNLINVEFQGHSLTMCQQCVNDLNDAFHNNMIEELRKIKSEIDEIVEEEMKEDERWSLGLRYSKKVIDNHIKEMKGEIKE